MIPEGYEQVAELTETEGLRLENLQLQIESAEKSVALARQALETFMSQHGATGPVQVVRDTNVYRIVRKADPCPDSSESESADSSSAA